MKAKPRYLRSLQKISPQHNDGRLRHAAKPGDPVRPCVKVHGRTGETEVIYAQSGNARIQALRTVWPIVFRRLEALPNINAMQLFEELCFQFPGRFTVRQ